MTNKINALHHLSFIMEIKIKTTMRYHLILVRMALKKKQNSVSMDV